jgi:hypothetical protein
MMGMMGMRIQKLGIKIRLDEHERMDFGENLEETIAQCQNIGVSCELSRRQILALEGDGPNMVNPIVKIPSRKLT